MVTPEIISYIKQEREKGAPDSIIKSNLLANGWSEADINDGLSQAAAINPAGVVELENYKNKILLNTFIWLVILDAVAIVILKLAYDTYGIFGLSPLSVLLRLLVIYMIASFTARGTNTIEKNTTATVLHAIGKVIGTTLMIILIIVGLFFAYCFFAFR